MVSHDIAEVAYMADRIAILSANPGRIRTVLDNTLGRPRNTRSPDFLWLLDHLHDIVTSAELPDVAVTTAAPSVVSRDLVEPIPSAQMAEILGLLEYLASQGGPCDLFQMAHETHGTFVEVLATVKGAEMLGMLDTPQRLVILTPLGRRFVAAGMEERKQIWGTQLQRLALFRVVRELLDLSGGELGREDVIAEIHQRLPREDAERIFETVVLWGRFGGLFNYLEEGGVLSLA